MSKDKWWEEKNPSYNWEGLYKALPDVDFGAIFESMPEELINAKPEEFINVRQADV